MVSRRDLLKGLGAAGLLPSAARAQLPALPTLPSLSPCPDGARYAWDRYPFRMGVASGDPTTTCVVLWTRLGGHDDVQVEEDEHSGLTLSEYSGQWSLHSSDVRDPQEPGALSPQTMVDSGTFTAQRDSGYSVHVHVQNLLPGTRYWYQFVHVDGSGAHRSTVGRTRTLAIGDSPVRFAVVSCQSLSGYYGGFVALSKEDVDFVLHLGDTIYEASTDVAVRHYRARHARFRRDPKARLAWSMHPFFTTWDDHEVDDNYHAESFSVVQRGAAYQAYYENMPMKLDVPPASWSDLQVYRRVTCGSVMDLAILDCKQYQRRGVPVPLPIQEQTMLGTGQKDMVITMLTESDARWKVLGSPVPMTDASQGDAWAWKGFQAERGEILDTAAQHAFGRTVVLSGDFHVNMVSALQGGSGAFTAGGTAVAAEFAGPGISSGVNTVINPVPDVQLPDSNRPWIQYLNNSYRGYLICDVTPTTWTTTFRALQDVTSIERSACVTNLAVFRLTNDSPVITKVSGLVPFQCYGPLGRGLLCNPPQLPPA